MTAVPPSAIEESHARMVRGIELIAENFPTLYRDADEAKFSEGMAILSRELAKYGDPLKAFALAQDASAWGDNGINPSNMGLVCVEIFNRHGLSNPEVAQNALMTLTDRSMPGHPIHASADSTAEEVLAAKAWENVAEQLLSAGNAPLVARALKHIKETYGEIPQDTPIYPAYRRILDAVSPELVKQAEKLEYA